MIIEIYDMTVTENSSTRFYALKLLVFVSAELKMDVLREREVKDNLERQLLDEQKMRSKCLSFICSHRSEPCKN